MRKAVVIIALLTALSGVLYSSSLELARTYYQNGVFSLSRNDSDGALSNFLLLAAMTNHGSAYDSYKSKSLYLAGDIYFSRRDFTNAALVYSLVTVEFPRQPEAVYSEYRLGSVLCSGGYYTKAVFVITNYLERRKDQAVEPARARYWLAKSFCGMGDFYSALKTFESILKEYPNASVCNEVRGSMRSFSYEKDILKVKDLAMLTNVNLDYEGFFHAPVFQRSAAISVAASSRSAVAQVTVFTAPPAAIVSSTISSTSSSLSSTMSSVSHYSSVPYSSSSSSSMNMSLVSSASKVSSTPVNGLTQASINIEFTKPVDMSDPGIMLVFLDDQYIGNLESLKKDETFVMPDYIQNTNVSDKSLGDIKTGLFQDAKKAVLKADSQPRPVLRIFYYASLKDKRPSFSGKDLKEDLKQIRKSIVANDLPNLGSSKDMPSPPLLFYYTIRLLYEEKLDFADNPEKDLLLTPEGFIIEMAGKLYLRKALIK